MDMYNNGGEVENDRYDASRITPKDMEMPEEAPKIVIPRGTRNPFASEKSKSGSNTRPASSETTTSPSYKKGGLVKKTGKATVHKGEYIVPKKQVKARKIDVSYDPQTGMDATGPVRQGL